MKAVILAAGKGTRLHPMTIDKPKGLLEIEETTILGRLVNQFKNAGIRDIIIVVGFKKELIKREFADDKSVTFFYYKDFSTTNNLHTLWAAKKYLDDNLILSFADLILDNQIIYNLTKSPKDISLAVHSRNILDGTMRIEFINERVKSITSTNKDSATGNFVGIAKLSKKGCRILIDQMSKIINKNFIKDYYTIAIDNYIKDGGFVEALDVKDNKWTEGDNIDDYYKARSLFK